jgi:hypothetical protein
MAEMPRHMMMTKETQDEETEEMNVEKLRSCNSEEVNSINSDDILLNNNEIDHSKLMKLLNNENTKL